MYCKNCGAVNPNGVKFCSVCGTALAPESKAQAKASGKPALSKNKLIALIAAAAAVVVLIVIIAVSVGSRKKLEPYQIAADRYIRSYLAMDAEESVETYPEFIVDEIIDETSGFDDIDDLIDCVQESFDEMAENWEDEIDVKYSKILKKMKFEITGNHEYSDDNVDDMNEYIEDYFDVESNLISEIRRVKIKLTFNWKNPDVEEKKTTYIYTAEIDGDWYVLTGDVFFDDGYYYRDEPLGEIEHFF